MEPKRAAITIPALAWPGLPLHPACSKMTRRIALLLVLYSLGSIGWLAADEPGMATVDFNREIRPILSNQCAKCHGPDAKERKGGTEGLRLDVRADATSDLGGYAAIVPGQPEKSELVKRILSTDDD